ATMPSASRRRNSLGRRLTFALAVLALAGLGVGLRSIAPDPSARESADGQAGSSSVFAETTAAKDYDNPYLDKVDEEIEDPRVRAAIRRVQPACVRIGGAS